MENGSWWIKTGSRLLLSFCGLTLSFLLGEYLGMELLETTQTSIKRRMDKHIVIYLCNKYYSAIKIKNH